MRARVPRTPDPEQARHAGVIQQRRHWRDGDFLPLEASPGAQRSAVHDVLRDSGRPLDRGLRMEMEARLGGDFSHVRVHADAAARASAAEIGARAYTSGEHVVLGPRGNDPHTLAHELTHVIQQRLGPVAGTDSGDGLRISDAGDRFERDAEAHAGQVMSGATPVQQTSQAQQMPPNSCPVDRSQLVIQRTPLPPSAPPPPPAAPSNGWKTIEALLAALGAAGFTPAQIRSPEFSLGDKERTVLDEWKKIAVKRSYVNQSAADAWDVQKLRNVLPRAADKQKENDLKAGEHYLAGEYQRINPLLAALGAAGFTPAQIRSPEFSLGDKERTVLEEWQRIAVDRGGPAVKPIVDAWDVQELRKVLEQVRGIHRAWTDFKPGGHKTLIRGDSENIYSWIKELDPATHKERPGLYKIDKKMVWPTFLSTSYGDPSTHSYVSKKTVWWKLTVEDSSSNLGRVLGGNNPSEEEVTFPVGTKLNIDEVQLKSAGTTPRVIVSARILKQSEP